VLGIRPEAFEDAAFVESGRPQIEVPVTVIEEIGSDTHLIFEVDAPRVDAEQLRAAAEDDDERLLAASGTSLFNARVDPRTRARVGERLCLAVQPRSFHFFDLAMGDNLLSATPAAV
jgi:multiple sugar transport system ATP-binding protein